MSEDFLSSYRILSKTPEFFLLQHKTSLQKSYYKEFFGSKLTENELFLISDNLSRRKSLFSPNLLQIYSFSVTKQSQDFKFGLIYEYWLQSFSNELLTKRNTAIYWSEEELINTLEAVLSGLFLLHTNSITHGNITSNDIVVTSEGFVKLADQFVTSSCYKKSFEQIIHEKKGYFSPEAVNNQWMETPENDLWAIGMVFLEAASLRNSEECLD